MARCKSLRRSDIRWAFAYPSGTTRVIGSGGQRRCRANPRKRPPWMRDPPRWLGLVVGEGRRRQYHPELARLRGKSGVYALRDSVSKEVLYVGESHTGRLYQTLVRHFQDPSGRFAELGEWVDSAPARLEVAWWVTPSAQAVSREASAIEYYCPSGNVETCERLRTVPFR